MFYLTVIFAANVIITAANFLTSGARDLSALLLCAFHSIYASAAVFVLDGVTAFLIRRFPEKLFAPGKKAFYVSKSERLFYRRLGVNRWKRFVPELGGFTGFHKDRLASSTDTAYLERFLLESNYGVVIHAVNALCGVPLLWLPFSGGASFTVPVGAVNFILSLLPAFILRSNTPGLLRLYEKSLTRQ
jgi:hypothetical protein